MFVPKKNKEKLRNSNVIPETIQTPSPSKKNKVSTLHCQRKKLLHELTGKFGVKWHFLPLYWFCLFCQRRTLKQNSNFWSFHWKIRRELDTVGILRKLEEKRKFQQNEGKMRKMAKTHSDGWMACLMVFLREFWCICCFLVESRECFWAKGTGEKLINFLFGRFGAMVEALKGERTEIKQPFGIFFEFNFF